MTSVPKLKGSLCLQGKGWGQFLALPQDPLAGQSPPGEGRWQLSQLGASLAGEGLGPRSRT